MKTLICTAALILASTASNAAGPVLLPVSPAIKTMPVYDSPRRLPDVIRPPQAIRAVPIITPVIAPITLPTAPIIFTPPPMPGESKTAEVINGKQQLP